MFVAVWPPPEVVERLVRLDRPEADGVRWTTPDQWHVTLRFLGDVGADDVSGLVSALALVAADARLATAVLGPVTGRFGNSILHVPVGGLDELADAVVAGTRGFGSAPIERRSFHGHITVARARGRKARVPADWAGEPIAGSWVVDRVSLVASDTRPTGARYSVAAEAVLGAASAE